MTALARWRKAKEEEEGGMSFKMKAKRPYLASECDSVQLCETYRQQIIRDISESVTAIQNAGLGEFRIRDLNDHINKLLREKKHWENRLRELGGKSYSSKGAKMLDREGKEVPGNRGYKYFGAARDLPGVRELFESDAPKEVKKTRAELMKDVDAQYYGFRDDDDIDIYMRERKDEEEELREAMEAGKESTVFARVKVPTQADIEEALLRRKKQELLEMYAIDGDDLDKFAAEDAAMDTAADDSARKPSQTAVEGLREVEGEAKPPGDEGAN